jgi:hypothetical protein
MGYKKLFSHDDLTGITKWWHDNRDGTVTIETVQDMNPILEANQENYKHTDKHTKWGDMSRVASIPLTIYYDLLKRGILNDENAMKKWLNSEEGRPFRTRAGKV